MPMIYANCHLLTSGRICLSINSIDDECHANLTLFGVTPDTLREWADKLEATIKEKAIKDRVEAEMRLS